VQALVFVVIRIPTSNDLHMIAEYADTRKKGGKGHQAINR